MTDGMEEAKEPAAGGEKETKKERRKEFLKHELRELSIIFCYLFVCFSVAMTAKALVLVQHNITDFGHIYGVSAIEALALGKIVAICQDLPLMSAWDKRPMFQSVMYKSGWMTVMVYIGGTLEEKLFHHEPPPIAHPTLAFLSHYLAFLFIFAVLFAIRELDAALGPGKLVKLFFGERPAQTAEPAA